jgi:outer membrane protein assembly factor BamB
VSGSPAVENGLIYINVGAKAAGCAAFRSTDGTVAWKATSDGASYASPVVADVAGKRAALFLARSGLHALDAKSGASLFFHPFRARIDASVNAATPILAEGGAFVSASYNTGAQWLNLADGKPRVRWKAADALACHYNTAVYHDGFLYGIDGRQEAGARLQCVDAKTGAVRWTKEGFGCASLIYADGKLLALRENGVLTMFEANPTEFRPQGEAKILTGTVRAHPALAGGRLYARDDMTLVSVKLDRR